jgi:CRP-like cAMP-binding protein
MKLFALITENYAQALIIKNYDRQEVIFSENELCTQVGFVMKGKLQIATYCTKDDPYVMSILNSGDTFGETLLFSNVATYTEPSLLWKNTKVGFDIKKAHTS